MKKLIFWLVLFVFATPSIAQQRIITAGSNITDIIRELGAANQVIAVDVTSRGIITSHPVAITGYHRQLSSEGLLALTPSLLIGSEEMGPESTLDTLRQAGVKVITAPSGNEVSDLLARITLLAKVTGTRPDTLIQQAKTEVAELESGRSQISDSPSMVFLMMMQGRGLMFAGRDTPADSMIRLAGATNPLAPLLASYKAVNDESLLKIKPQWILVSERTIHQLGSKQALLDAYPILKSVPGGTPTRILVIPGRSLIGGLGLQSLKTSLNIQKQLINAQRQ